jgi:hypothetical protein
VNKNTNSGTIGGIAFKLALQNGDGMAQSFGLELLNVKHPKEFRYNGYVNNFVWGKENNLYAIRFLYGREKLLYRKAPQQGVQISAFVAGGPTWGIVAPYYVQDGEGNFEKFSTDLGLATIQGSGKKFQGLAEAEHEFGFSAKTGLSFEFGSFKNTVAGIETGVAVEAYTHTIQIMAEGKNRAVYNSLYFTLYWGSRR